ncbi:uncharacterized protein LOC122307249 isoform X2 [Carya illinoinensis]|uniref:Uncharacterized protein n=1 Tax=Carya illinoinensis TaxID=32201 RepID=A0A922F755_CARIL|nr:uncharacterized protein LOC122307249 isoform X2 [Carya illinoinensis]KAG6717424.1 hypothetical protein I3842_04G098300 [Carya illinoinensis]KAG6717425.1 hypothetical protein I3842_04G098300 [Carya illinoinensis]
MPSTFTNIKEIALKTIPSASKKPSASSIPSTASRSRSFKPSTWSSIGRRSVAACWSQTRPQKGVRDSEKPSLEPDEQAIQVERDGEGSGRESRGQIRQSPAWKRGEISVEQYEYFVGMMTLGPGYERPTVMTY